MLYFEAIHVICSTFVWAVKRTCRTVLWLIYIRGYYENNWADNSNRTWTIRRQLRLSDWNKPYRTSARVFYDFIHIFLCQFFPSFNPRVGSAVMRLLREFFRHRLEAKFNTMGIFLTDENALKNVMFSFSRKFHLYRYVEMRRWNILAHCREGEEKSWWQYES